LDAVSWTTSSLEYAALGSRTGTGDAASAKHHRVVSDPKLRLGAKLDFSLWQSALRRRVLSGQVPLQACGSPDSQL
jgi:hypothetical protein